MKYDEIFSQYYLKETDQTFFQLSKDDAYATMIGWLHSIIALPYVRKCFRSISLDDEIMELTYELTNSIDEVTDVDFVKEMFAQGMVICWLHPKVESIENLLTVLGTKEEKRLQSNYKANYERLEKLEIKLKKYIRDSGYANRLYTQ